MTAAGQSALNVQGPRHGRHRRHAVRQRHRARTQRAHPHAPRARTRSCRWRGACTGASRAAGLHPVGSRHRLRVAAADGPGVPARGRLRARRADVRGARRARRRAGSAGAARSRCVPRRRCERLESRGVDRAGPALTRTARRSRRCRWSAPWAELIVHGDDALLPYLAVMSARRVAAPHDARRARPGGPDGCGKRSPHGLQRVRRGVRHARLHGRGVRPAAPRVRGRGDRASGPSDAACS